MAEKRSETASTTQPNAEARHGDETRRHEQGGRPESRERGLARRWPETSLFANPFSLLGRLADEMTSVFDEFSPSGFRQTSGFSQPRAWSPSLDVFQRGNELVVRADLPGMSADDIHVDVSDDAITVSGERQNEYRDERNGVYRFERSYGSFSRTIPLPEGTITDQAKATFKNGVLEITVPAPPEQVSRGRRLEITRGEEQKPTSK